MKTSNKTMRTIALLALGASLSFAACKKSSKTENPVDTTTPDANKFAIVGGLNNPTALYLLTTGDLSTGVVTTVGKGTEISGWSRLLKNGFYYNLANNKFSKSKLENSILTEVAAIPVTGNVMNGYWLNDNTVLFSGGNSTAANAIMNYTIVNTESMTIVKTGSFGKQLLQPTDKSIYTSSCFLKGDKLYVTYAIYNSNWTATDTAYLASAPYPALDQVTITKDTRSTYPGSFAPITPNSVNYNNDVYMISNTGDRWGVNPAKPTGIFRIKNGATAFDSDYFFNLSAISDGNREYYGLWDLGNGKAITRMGRKDLLVEFDDYNNKDVFEYYVIDVVNKTRTKLDLPLDKGVLVSPVLVEDNKAYIAISSSSQGKFVWTYDISSAKLTKGLEIKGVDYISTLSRFK
ncbi:DUF4374 domain-containing protein [Pedobacter steynii]|uniref:DUF4374 domain-containing protein n=1 Tax=Pedobacter steynii TaxID=430522 RepID=A0A1D7QKM3_9SPHI|nr:DUF4374 domain-containing protein [Pedobacter steynii]AOM79217.1 hypothetical protein BFS30_19820 [Pedobacter steynii]